MDDQEVEKVFQLNSWESMSSAKKGNDSSNQLANEQFQNLQEFQGGQKKMNQKGLMNIGNSKLLRFI